jgi:hypothetical protein
MKVRYLITKISDNRKVDNRKVNNGKVNDGNIDNKKSE